jgi:hypothetical protein
MPCQRLVAIFLVALATCACSQTKSPPSGETAGGTAAPAPAASAATAGSTTFNPCKLVSPAEVSAVMGRASGKGEYHPILGGRCNFYDAQSQDEIFLQSVDPSLFDAYAHVPGAVTLSGIGDRAIWVGGSLYVQKGSRGLQIGFFLPHALKQLTPSAEKLARTIVSRM